RLESAPWSGEKTPQTHRHPPDEFLHGDSVINPSAHTEDVLLGASAPRHARPGQRFVARFVAYAKGLETHVKEQLERLSPRADSHLGLRRCCWRPGTLVKVILHGDCLQVSSPEEEFTWLGESNLVDFDVELSADARETATVLKFDVFIDGFLLAKIRLDLEIAPGTDAQTRSVSKTEPSRTAFASYASQDRDRVLDRVAAIRICAGVDVFLDCLSLTPGEEWKSKIRQEILNRDVFLLFWSSHAKRSQWVTWEWQTAIQEKGISGIQLHPLE